MSAKILCLPLYEELSLDDIDRIADMLIDTEKLI